MDIGNPLTVAAMGGDHDSPVTSLSRGARLLIEHQTEDDPLIGYFVVGIYGKGGYSCGFRTPDGHLINKTLFTAMLKIIIERELIGKAAAEDYARESVT